MAARRVRNLAKNHGDKRAVSDVRADEPSLGC
jgi:hypothetical protein